MYRHKPRKSLESVPSTRELNTEFCDISNIPTTSFTSNDKKGHFQPGEALTPYMHNVMERTFKDSIAVEKQPKRGEKVKPKIGKDLDKMKYADKIKGFEVMDVDCVKNVDQAKNVEKTKTGDKTKTVDKVKTVNKVKNIDKVRNADRARIANVLKDDTPKEVEMIKQANYDPYSGSSSSNLTTESSKKKLPVRKSKKKRKPLKNKDDNLKTASQFQRERNSK